MKVTHNPIYKRVYTKPLTARVFRSCMLALANMSFPPVEDGVTNMISITGEKGITSVPELFQVYQLHDGSYQYRHLEVDTHKTLSEIDNIDVHSFAFPHPCGGKTIELLRGVYFTDLSQL
jgi:hypothetical protein